MPNKPTMTSREAAALYLSGGKTDDVETAELLDQGKILDPDALERAYYRRIFGFDFSVEIDAAKNKAVARDNDLGISVSCAWHNDDDKGNSKRLAKTCIKLKAKHDKCLIKHGDTPEGEVVDA